MWILLILFFGPNLFMQQELYQYETKQACQVERDRIGFLMAESSPHEHDFDIVCRFRPLVVQPA